MFFHNKNGYALPIIIILVLMFMMLSLTAMSSAFTSHYIIEYDLMNKQCYYTAVSGIEYALAVLNEQDNPNPDFSIVELTDEDFPYALSNYKVEIKVESNEPGKVEISSTGKLFDNEGNLKKETKIKAKMYAYRDAEGKWRWKIWKAEVLH